MALEGRPTFLSPTLATKPGTKNSLPLVAETWLKHNDSREISCLTGEKPSMSVAFKELAGSPLETYGPEGMRAERRFLCAWDDRHALVEQLLGDACVFGGSSRSHYPSKSSVVAMRVRVEPFDEDLKPQQFEGLSDGLAAYHGFARVTVDYELLVPSDHADLPAAEDNTFLTYRMEPGHETLTLAGDGLVWPGNSAATLSSDADGVVLLPFTRHRLLWQRVLSPPFDAIRNSTGTLNQSTFLGAAAGTLLFEGVNAEREFLQVPDLADTEFAWRLEYLFRENSLATVAGQPLFRSTDFDALLTYETPS